MNTNTIALDLIDPSPFRPERPIHTKETSGPTWNPDCNCHSRLHSIKSGQVDRFCADAPNTWLLWLLAVEEPWWSTLHPFTLSRLAPSDTLHKPATISCQHGCTLLNAVQKTLSRKHLHPASIPNHNLAVPHRILTYYEATNNELTSLFLKISLRISNHPHATVVFTLELSQPPISRN